MARLLRTVVVPMVLLLLLGCAPESKGPVREVGTTPDRRTPPTLPAGRPVPDAAVVDALVFDLTNAPGDLDLWVPPVDEATCAARGIVGAVGAERLVDLGYRPGTPGSAVNQVDLTDDERTAVTRAVAGCVDVEAAVGSLLAGSDLLPGRAAACVARGLAAKRQLEPFVEAWAFRSALDPFEGGKDGLAPLVLSYADVCLSDSSFNWSLRSTTTTSTSTSVP